ncbi:MAG: hypothetical protein JO125_14160, partial [Chloroflexi bacterium]|nr:hypothetical protein [Chloroflexota bacterium]
VLLAHSRERELAAALAQQREPCLHYPALDIEEVRRRITAFLQLDVEISQQEPNAIVRRFYHGALEEEVTFLRLIEATYDRSNERYWSLNLRLNPMPTQEEMDYALSYVKQTLSYGLKHPQTVEVSQRLIHFMDERLHLSLTWSCLQAVVPMNY